MEEGKEATHTTFLIVGAGPAGLITGIGLSRLGLKTHIIERNNSQIRPVCGEYLSPEGIHYLNLLELNHTLESFNPIEGMILYSSYETKIETHFPGSNKGVSLNREIFQTKLANEFKNLGGIIHYGESLKNVFKKEQGFEIQTTGHFFTSDFLIGADGRQSQVARSLNLKSSPPHQKRVALHCYLKPKTPLPGFGQMHILPDGSYIGINPLSSFEVNFSIVTSHKSIKEAGGTKELINFWIRNRGSLSQQFELITREKIKTTFPLTRNSLDICNGSVVLVGDAAGFIDPLTGEGITTAIKTAHALCEEINLCSDIEEAFKKYEKRRLNEFKEKEALNRGFQKLIFSPIGCETLGLILNLSKHLRNTFIGVIGNVYRPRKALKELLKLYLQERS